MSSSRKSKFKIFSAKYIKFKVQQNYFDFIKKCFPRLILGVAFCFTFPLSSQCREICAEGLFLASDDFIKISQDIYLSSNGKLYQKLACESYLTKEDFKEYLEQYSDLKKQDFTERSIDSLPDTNNTNNVVVYDNNNVVGNNNVDGSNNVVADGNVDGSNNQVDSINSLSETIFSKLIDIEKVLPNIHNISLNNIEFIIDIISDKNIEYKETDTLESAPTLKPPLPQQIEISPTYSNKFVELEREPTASELLAIKRYLLEKIDSQLHKRYKPNYILLENNNIRLWAKIENLNREVTDSKWENLELTMTPLLGNLTQIDIEVSAILRTQSGLGNNPPAEKTFKYSEEEKALQEYISQLITYLKEKIPISDFKFDEE